MEILTTVVHDKVQGAFEAGYTTVSAQGSSRCFAKGTLIRMFNGSLKAVENIVVGDKVMNIEGNGYNTVTETHSGIDKMYKIYQYRGINYVVNSRHILCLMLNGVPVDIETKIFYNLSKEEQKKYRGYCADGSTVKIRIVELKHDEYYGFTLDNSPYFLLQDGTVVHNSSKTYNILIWLIIRCINYPGTTVSIVRCSLPTIRGSVLRDMVEILTNMGIYNPKNLNNTQMIYTFSNGSYIEFFSTDNEQKIRGRKRQILYCNECNEITNYDAFVQLKIRTTLFTILDYNPSFTDEHWLNDINREAKTYHFITTYKDNPFLEQNVIDELESLQWKNPSLWQVFGLGQRAMVEGLIFTNFTVEKKLPELKKQWIGIDFGFTNDPTAIVLVGVIDDTLYIHELAYERKMLSKDIAQVLCKSRYKHLPIICDSADPRLRKEIANVARSEFRTDLEIIPVKKSNGGSIMPSIDKMSMYKIKITETSYNVIREFKNYTYTKDREGNWINKPIEKFNHAIDAIRYVVMTKLLGGMKKRGLRITR